MYLTNRESGGERVLDVNNCILKVCFCDWRRGLWCGNVFNCFFEEGGDGHQLLGPSHANVVRGALFKVLEGHEHVNQCPKIILICISDATVF